MDLSEKLQRLKPANIDGEEWQLRLELAACYRLFDWMGWTELIYNHITLRVPGPERHYLINPYGLWYNEVTASNLVRVNLAGEAVDGSKYPVNTAGFVIHSAVHAARDDAHCIIHTHTTAGSAVSCKKDGLRFDNFYGAALYGQVAYHDFEGVTVNPDEQQRLLADIGSHRAVVLRNHGLLSWGGDITEAFMWLWTLQRACDVQIAAASAGPVVPVPAAVLAQTVREAGAAEPAVCERVFAALLRQVQRRDPGYLL